MTNYNLFVDAIMPLNSYFQCCQNFFWKFRAFCKKVSEISYPLQFYLFCPFYCIFMWQFLNNLWDFFFKKFSEEKRFLTLAQWSQISDISAIFSQFSGSFWPKMKYRAFLGKVSTPDTTKIFVGILSQISGEIRNFGQYGNTGYF